MDAYELLLTISLGVGLSAACGFRVFVPLLFISAASKTGHLTLGEEFAWMASDPAMIVFAVATGLEIGAYYIPWLDNMLDSVASPAAVVAGTVVTASVIGDVSPLMKWATALIAGGGTAGVVQGVTVVARGLSTASTGGVGNPVIATAELGGSVAMGALSIFLPIAALILLPLVAAFAGWKLYQRKTAAKPPVIEASVA